MKYGKQFLFLLALAWTFPFPRAAACNIPVFRYALERWRADRGEDRYQAIILHRGLLPPKDQVVIESLRAFGEGRKALGNLTVETVDLAGKVEEPMRKLWQEQVKPPMLPWLVVRYPDAGPGQALAWAGPLDVAKTWLLLESPARQEIARRLLRGDSVVWVLLESGDRRQDEAAFSLLTTELKKLEKTLKLPDPTGDNTVELLSRLPLRLKFSSLRVKRDDPAEQLFVPLLLHGAKDLTNPIGPVVFPLFGRGRVLDGLAGKDLKAETIEDAARFLCGACSCVVKRENPGTDLLLAADWDSLLDDRDTLEARSPIVPRVSLPHPPVRETDPPSSDDSPPPGNPRKPLLMAIVVASLLVVGTGVWALRSRPRNNGAPSL